MPRPDFSDPNIAREYGLRGGRKKMTPVQKLEAKERKKQLRLYSEALEVRLSKFDKVLRRIEKELLTPRIQKETLPDGTIRETVLPLSEGKLELLLKLQKNLHEQVLGKPKMQVENTGNVPITLVINEEKDPTPITVVTEEVVIDPNLRITEESDDTGT